MAKGQWLPRITDRWSMAAGRSCKGLNMTPMMISVIAFVGVSALVGLVAFVLRDQNPKTQNRLDLLVGKRRRDDPETDILRRQAFDSDKKNLLEQITPNLPTRVARVVAHDHRRTLHQARSSLARGTEAG